MKTLKDKLKSRKFWLAVSSVLASIATAIAGLAIDNEAVAIVGIVCGVVASAIYEIVEAVLDWGSDDDVESITQNEDGTTTVVYKKEEG